MEVSSRQSLDSTAGANRQGWQTVRPRSERIRRFSKVRESGSLHSSIFTAAERNLDIFLSDCSFDTTEQHIIDHLISKYTRVINCVSIEANVSWYTLFKIIVSLDDRGKLLSPSL